MLKDIKLIIIDVDGTLTDSGIYYDETGNELKRFSTRDAAGFFAARAAQIKTMILTGRECKATIRRMEEMKVDYIFQNVSNKKQFLIQFMQNNNIDKSQIAYIGDDINDLEIMKLVEFVGCPADSCEEVKNLSNYISKMNGGYGAARDVIEYILKERNEWKILIEKVYGSGI